MYPIYFGHRSEMSKGWSFRWQPFCAASVSRRRCAAEALPTRFVADYQSVDVRQFQHVLFNWYQKDDGDKTWGVFHFIDRGNTAGRSKTSLNQSWHTQRRSCLQIDIDKHDFALWRPGNSAITPTPIPPSSFQRPTYRLISRNEVSPSPLFPWGWSGDPSNSPTCPMHTF